MKVQGSDTNNNTILFSVAMCTYNGAKYLDEQIDSIVNQTYPPFQIIVSDDHSSDGTWEILQQWKARYPSLFEIYRQEKNIGFNQNFAFALSKVRGNYVSLSDQDDVWYPFKLSDIADGINKSPSTVVFHHSEDILLNEKNGQLKEEGIASDYWQPYEGNGVGIIFVLNRLSGHVLTIKASFLEEILPIPDGIIYDWWICVLAASKGYTRFIPKKLMKYRLHLESTYFSNLSEKLSNVTPELLKALFLFEKIQGFSEIDKQLLKKFQKIYSRHEPKKFDLTLFCFFVKKRYLLFKDFHIGGSRLRKEIFLIRLCRAYSKW